MAVLGTNFRYDLLLLLRLRLFTLLKMALKFIGSSSLLEECGSKNKVTTDDLMNSGAIHKFRGHP